MNQSTDSPKEALGSGKSSLTESQVAAALLAKTTITNSTHPLFKKGVTEQLELDGYSAEDVAYAVSTLEPADWHIQAAIVARKVLEYNAYSQKGLAHRLEAEDGYTPEATAYAMASLKDVDWDEQAVQGAKYWSGILALSRPGMIKRLEQDGYTLEQAERATEPFSERDWVEQAVQAAKKDLNYGRMVSRAVLIRRLEGAGFTPSQVGAAMRTFGAGSLPARAFRGLKGMFGSR